MKTLMITLDAQSEHIWETFKAGSSHMLDNELFATILRSAAVSMVDFMAKVDKEQGAATARAFGLKPKEEAS